MSNTIAYIIPIVLLTALIAWEEIYERLLTNYIQDYNLWDGKWHTVTKEGIFWNTNEAL